MTHHFWSFSDSWVLIPILGLAVISLQGPLVAGRQGHKLKNALMANGPGPLGEDARRLTVDRLLWSAGFTNLGLVLAIIWVMVEKPGWGGGIAALVVGYAVGVALAVMLAQKPAAEAPAVSEPA
jgi:uncharacterized membrane protein